MRYVDVHAMAVRTIHSHSQVQSLDVWIFKFRKVFVVTLCLEFSSAIVLAAMKFSDDLSRPHECLLARCEDQVCMGANGQEVQ